MLRRGTLSRATAASWSSLRSFASKPKKPIVLNDFTRVRELSKKLKVTADEVVKHACRKHYRKYYMTHHDVKYKFDTLKQVILPLDLAARIADHFGVEVAYEALEPQDIVSDPSLGVLVSRPPVIAVMGHVDHGKTTLMDTLRGANVAKHEVENITQKIHVCDTMLAPDVPVTFLDTPGHFHFTRMRNNAADVADVVVLVVAADEGCRLQTDESIGCIESLDVPTVVCVNKVDLVQHGALRVGDHFICGMLHGVVKNLKRANGDDVAVAWPGHVVDVCFKRLSKHKDAPLEFSLHVVTKDRAEAVLHQRSELAMDFQAAVEVADDNEKVDDEMPAKGFFGTPIVIKTDTAGSLTSILDTVDASMPGIHTAHMGLGHVTTKDVERGCTIFGFNVRVGARERKLAKDQHVKIVIRPTIHELLEEIALVADEHDEELNEVGKD
ncbi:hypothetical protein DYB37_011953 [Aphanomyces astaci]|uniref:Tr-type G domain-containing protein n=1 Tax=Aphanomyces astaci TaxID=112090 RepID=A0A3R6XW79_APHAT|nr:hypothetical protein DYB37_011953 [Aphanomyces astaci]